MTQKEIKRLISIAQTFPGYDSAAKDEFHKLGKRYLNEIARIMELTPADFEIRSNKAGNACLGEVTLHSTSLYVQLGGSLASSQFFYRCVKGMKDFYGGANTWMAYDRLLSQGEVAEQFVRHLDSHRYEWAS